jgi:hypothetical protein
MNRELSNLYVEIITNMWCPHRHNASSPSSALVVLPYRSVALRVGGAAGTRKHLG